MKGFVMELCCSFCGRSQKEIKKLISGPNVFVCEECVALMVDVLREEIDPNFMVKNVNLEAEIDGNLYELAYLINNKKLAWVSTYKTHD